MTKDEARAAALQATKEFAEKVVRIQVECMSTYSAQLAALEPALKDMTRPEQIGLAAEIDAIMNEVIIT